MLRGLRAPPRTPPTTCRLGGGGGSFQPHHSERPCYGPAVCVACLTVYARTCVFTFPTGGWLLRTHCCYAQTGCCSATRKDCTASGKSRVKCVYASVACFEICSATLRSSYAATTIDTCHELGALVSDNKVEGPSTCLAVLGISVDTALCVVNVLYPRQPLAR